ncbi:MAG: hypothetical protein ACOCUY_01885 [Verrucomicrobiota bacterium]
MPRGRQHPLTDEEKNYMKQRRAEARREKEEAMAMLENNPQLKRSSFWRSVDSDTVKEVSDAIKRADKELKQREINRLEKKLNKLREDV